MLGAADARAVSTRARSTRSAFISSFRVRAAAVARAIATTTAPMSEAAYACDETAGVNHAEVVPLAVAMAKTAMTAKTAAKAEWMRSVRDGTTVPPTFFGLRRAIKGPTAHSRRR